VFFSQSALATTVLLKVTVEFYLPSCVRNVVLCGVLLCGVLLCGVLLCGVLLCGVLLCGVLLPHSRQDEHVFFKEI
jgi:hypothetical protein